MEFEAEKFPWLLTTLTKRVKAPPIFISPVNTVQGQGKKPATKRVGCSGVSFPSSLSAPEVQLYPFNDYKWLFFGN